MMNKFLKVVMNNKNSFMCLSAMTIYGYHYELEVKIDTGCSYSTIPIKRLETYTAYELNEMKKRDIYNKIDAKISYGVESGGKRHKKLTTDQDKLNSSAIKINFPGASTQTPQGCLPPASQERGIRPNLATLGASLHDAEHRGMYPPMIQT